MSRSIRKLVGVGAAALALGGFFALIVAPLVAGAWVSNRTLSGSSVSTALLHAEALSTGTATKVRVPAVVRTATPTAACTAARQALDAAKAKDKAEDAAELAAGKPDDVIEDKAEFAALKPLITAVMTTCGLTKPAPSAACSAAMQAVKAAIEKDRAEDATEKAAGTEGSAADVAEDQAERAAIEPLWQNVRTACGFGTRFTTHTISTRFTSTWHWGDRR